MKLPDAFAPLRHGVFARYMSGEFISMIGTWMQLSAQSWVITTLTDKAEVLGRLNFVAMLPTLLFTLIGGRFADRYNKRTILLVALVVQFSAAVVSGWLIERNLIAIWHLYTIATIVGIATAFEVPAVAAFVPELVPREEMAGAIAIDRSSFHATRLIGPSVGGYLVAAYGVAAAYYLNAFTFLALGLALFTIRGVRATAAAKETTPSSQGIGAGLAYVRSDTPTLVMTGLMSSLTMFVSPFVIMSMPHYTRHLLNLDPRGMGELMAISGVGSLTGTLLLLRIHRGGRSMALKLAACALVAGLCGMAAAHTFWVAAGFLVLFTAGMSLTFGAANTVIQERAPDHLRGRVSSVTALAYFGVVPFSGLAINKAIDLFGMRTTMLAGAAGYALAATLLLAGRERLAGAPALSEPSAT